MTVRPIVIQQVQRPLPWKRAHLKGGTTVDLWRGGRRWSVVRVFGDPTVRADYRVRTRDGAAAWAEVVTRVAADLGVPSPLHANQDPGQSPT